MLPRYIRSRLYCNGHSLLFSSYLTRIGRIENPSCSACGHPTQDSSHFILHCLAWDSLRRSLFGDSTVCLFTTSGPVPESCQASGLYSLLSCPHPAEGVG